MTAVKITVKMDAVPESETAKNKYPQTSSVWNYYKNVSRENRTAVCMYCGETLSYRGTISNLKKHVKRRHNIEMVPSNDDNVTDTDDEKEEVLQETYLDEDIILETEEERFDKRKALRSGVWTYFEVSDEEQRLATCRLCREDYSYRTSSSNLAKHLKRRHSVSVRTGEEESEGREEKSYRKSSNGKTSIAWDYFTIKDPTRRVAACKVCDVECSYYSSVSNLMKHVRRKHGMSALTDDEQNDEEEKEATSPKSHHNNNRSSVWLYFKKVDKKSGVAVCLICKKRLSYISTLTNLKRHLGRKHPHVQLDKANEGKTMLVASDGQLYEIEDNSKQEILDIDDDDRDDDQSAEPLQQIYLDEIEGNVIEKPPKLPKKLKRIVMEDSNDTSDDEVTLKKRYVRTVHDSLDRFGKYLVSLLRQLPKEVSNQLQADFVKQIMNCQNNDVAYVATLKECRQDDTVAVSSVCADEGYAQTTVVDN